MTVTNPTRLLAVVVGTIFCIGLFGWGVGAAYFVGALVGSFKLND